MKAINWIQYGLKKNPFSTLPLYEGGELSIDKAFVGRNYERESLDNFFRSADQGCVVIGGQVGVGKTSLVNFQKSLWKYGNKSPLLFSYRREIEANTRMLNKDTFLLEILGSIIREIELIDEKIIKINPVLNKIDKLVDLTINTYTSTSSEVTGNIGFLSGSVGKQTQQQQSPPLQITTSFLVKCFTELIETIRTIVISNKQYKGLIVHINNFDVVLDNKENKSKVINFFQEIRDLLQTPHVFFIFLGPAQMYKDIIRPYPRLRSIFYPQPLILNPLTKQEILSALKERMELLKSENVSKVIKPVEDNVIYYLYDLFEGDLRSVFNALNEILYQVSDTFPTTLQLDESIIFLGKEKWDNISKQLTPEQQQVLNTIVEYEKDFTGAELSRLLNKGQTNMSAYYFGPLRDLGVIELVTKKGREKFWKLTKEYEPLKEAVKVQKRLTKIPNATKQDSLFKDLYKL